MSAFWLFSIHLMVRSRSFFTSDRRRLNASVMICYLICNKSGMVQMPYSTILARFMAFMPIALQICCMFSSIAGTEYYVKTIDGDGLTKLNVSDENSFCRCFVTHSRIVLLRLALSSWVSTRRFAFLESLSFSLWASFFSCDILRRCRRFFSAGRHAGFLACFLSVYFAKNY